jgi:hypothetical protein
MRASLGVLSGSAGLLVRRRARFYRVIPPSALPGISPTGGEIGWEHPLAPRSSSSHCLAGSKPRVDLPPCGGDVRQDRGGYCSAPTSATSPSNSPHTTTPPHGHNHPPHKTNPSTRSTPYPHHHTFLIPTPAPPRHTLLVTALGAGSRTGCSAARNPACGDDCQGDMTPSGPMIHRQNRSERRSCRVGRTGNRGDRAGGQPDNQYHRHQTACPSRFMMPTVARFCFARGFGVRGGWDAGWLRTRNTPLCPAGHLPHRWGDWLGFNRSLQPPRLAAEQATSRSPPLWGRCPAGQRGRHTAQLRGPSRQNTAPAPQKHPLPHPSSRKCETFYCKAQQNTLNTIEI